MQKILRRFNIQNAKPVSTLFSIHLKLLIEQSLDAEVKRPT